MDNVEGRQPDKLANLTLHDVWGSLSRAGSPNQELIEIEPIEDESRIPDGVLPDFTPISARITTDRKLVIIPLFFSDSSGNEIVLWRSLSLQSYIQYYIPLIGKISDVILTEITLGANSHIPEDSAIWLANPEVYLRELFERGNVQLLKRAIEILNNLKDTKYHFPISLNKQAQISPMLTLAKILLSNEQTIQMRSVNSEISFTQLKELTLRLLSECFGNSASKVSYVKYLLKRLATKAQEGDYIIEFSHFYEKNMIGEFCGILFSWDKLTPERLLQIYSDAINNAIPISLVEDSAIEDDVTNNDQIETLADLKAFLMLKRSIKGITGEWPSDIAILYAMITGTRHPSSRQSQSDEACIFLDVLDTSGTKKVSLIMKESEYWRIIERLNKTEFFTRLIYAMKAYAELNDHSLALSIFHDRNMFT